MSQVDFGYICVDSQLSGITIYLACFQKYLHALRLNRPKSEWSKLIPKTEAVFEFLVEQGNINGFNVDAILEIPDPSGNTCFNLASRCSETICNYIIARPIQVNSINTHMMAANFEYPKLSIRMMKKRINPYLIPADVGTSEVDRNPSSFESEEAKLLLSQFPRSVHFSVEDIECGSSCPAGCSSEFKRFYYKNGPLVDMEQMTDEDRLGTGGFGLVFKQLFHGKLMAMKCVWIDQIEQRYLLNESVSVLNENISEIRKQTATRGPGVIVPVAFVRQQDQEQDENGKWIANNYNIFIYPLYDCNLYELHKNNFDCFTDDVLRDILSQCLQRKRLKLFKWKI